MDTIFIEDLRVQTRIGVYDWELHVEQPLIINIELQIPSARVFASGDFDDALDYSALVRRLQSLAKDHPHRLLERFADAIAHVVRGEFGSPWVKVRVAKISPVAGVRHLGVAIERGERR
jgi:dihydroneopterin aldolase